MSEPMNSIAEGLWDEWAALPQGSEETDSSELAGLAAALPFKIKGGGASLSTSRLGVLRRLTKLWKNSIWKLEWNAVSIAVPPGMKGQVTLSLPSDVYEAIAAYEGGDRWAWMRGLWGGGGSLYVPRSGYYLAVRAGAAAARRASRLLRGAGIPAGERAYGKHGKNGQSGKRELTVRDQQGIVAFLNKIGLTGASLRVENKAILRSMRDQANRIRNCDTANINKVLRAAEEQTHLAAEIFKNGLAESLPRNLRALAEARLEHPEESLSELGRRLSPPITKSTVKYRWTRLQDFVNERAQNLQNLPNNIGEV